MEIKIFKLLIIVLFMLSLTINSWAYSIKILGSGYEETYDNVITHEWSGNYLLIYLQDNEIYKDKIIYIKVFTIKKIEIYKFNV